jgi:hypothetical protein
VVVCAAGEDVHAIFLLFALSSPGFIDTTVDSKPVASVESRSTQVRLFMTSVCLPELAFAHLQHIAYAYGLTSSRLNHEHGPPAAVFHRRDRSAADSKNARLVRRPIHLWEQARGL